MKFTRLTHHKLTIELFRRFFILQEPQSLVLRTSGPSSAMGTPIHSQTFVHVPPDDPQTCTEERPTINVSIQDKHFYVERHVHTSTCEKTCLRCEVTFFQKIFTVGSHRSLCTESGWSAGVGTQVVAGWSAYLVSGPFSSTADPNLVRSH